MADVQGALKYLRDGEKLHSNRKDICREGTTSRGSNGPFSRSNRREVLRAEQTNAKAPDSIGSGLGQPNGVASGFGAPQNAPQVLQQPQQSGFGRQASGFGQPSQPQGFGVGATQQPQNTFPAPSQPQSSFGQNPMQNGNAGFGQQIAQKENVGFGSQAPTPQSGFGGGLAQQSSGLGGFGQPTPLTQQPNGFFVQQNQPQQQSSQSHVI